MAKEISALTSFETLRLQELERKITEGFLSMADGLMEIRDKRLYRANHKTYEDYMQERWGKTARWAEQLIKSAVVVKQLPKEMRTMVRNERTARALTSVPEQTRVAVVEHINNNNKPVNSATVKLAAAAIKKEKVFDKEGVPVPDYLVARWNRRQEFVDMMTQISTIKCQLERFEKDNDEIWRKVDHVAIERAEQLYSAIAKSIPHTVCSGCNGAYQTTKKDGICPQCDSTGFMTEQQYVTTKEEDKRVRKNYANSLQGLSKPVSRQCS